MVGDRIVNGIGGGFACADLDGRHLSAVHERCNPEIEIGLRSRDRCSKIVVGITDVNNGWVFAVDVNLRRISAYYGHWVHSRRSVPLLPL